MVSLTGVRVLPGRYGTWYTRNGRSILISEEADPFAPSGEVLQVISDAGLLDKRDKLYGATVMLTSRCNLACAYCFQNESGGESGITRIDRHDLTARNVERVRDFVAEQMLRHGKSELHLLLTGGEPLMNYANCLELLDAMAPLGAVQAEMFTNGVLLSKDRAVALSQAGLTRIQVSFDGAGDEHDRYRKTPAGVGSYARIMQNLVNTLDAAPNLKVTMRLNITARNVPTLDQLLLALSEVAAGRKLAIRFGLVDDIGLNFVDAPDRSATTAEQIRDLALIAMELGLDVEPMAAPGDCLFCGVIGGGSGSVINADGTLYSCWESVGRTELAVGDVTRGYLAGNDLTERWVDCSYNIVDRNAATKSARQISDVVDTAVLDRSFELLNVGSAS